MKHSTNVTYKIEFDCGRSAHLKLATEKDGTKDIRVIQGKTGVCPGCLLGFLGDILNLSLKKVLTLDELCELAKGHRCQNQVPGFKSCIDELAKQIKASYETK